jgi:hypothetical protein
MYRGFLRTTSSLQFGKGSCAMLRMPAALPLPNTLHLGFALL